MMRKQIIGAVVVALVFAASGFASTLVNNGSFETCTVAACPTQPPPGNWQNLLSTDPTQSAGLANWVIDSGNIDWVNTNLWHPPTGGGSYSIDLSGSTPGDIYQVISVTPGASYTVTWFGGMDPDAFLVGLKTSVTGTLRVQDVGSGGGNANLAETFFHVNYDGSSSRPNAIWQQYATSFVPVSNSIRIFFSSQEPGNGTGTNYGPLLDMVTLDNTVPEPAAWSLVFSGGLLCVVAAIRRRRRS
jgi:hypothetical protein